MKISKKFVKIALFVIPLIGQVVLTKKELDEEIKEHDLRDRDNDIFRQKERGE